MIHAYFDDSATLNQQGFICLCGYVAGDADWDALAKKWVEALARHQLPSFHTSNFLSARAEYKSTKLSHDDRLRVVEEFIAIIRNHVPLAIAVAVDSKAYRKVFSGIAKKFSPVEFCCYRIIRAIASHAEQLPARILPVSLVFDESQTSLKFHAAMIDVKRNRPEVREIIATLAFGDDRFVQPLQAADLLACFTVRELRKDEGRAWTEAPACNLFERNVGSRPMFTISEVWDEGQLLAADFTKITTSGDT
jgi:hypothetical protein